MSFCAIASGSSHFQGVNSNKKHSICCNNPNFIKPLFVQVTWKDGLLSAPVLSSKKRLAAAEQFSRRKQKEAQHGEIIGNAKNQIQSGGEMDRLHDGKDKEGEKLRASNGEEPQSEREGQEGETAPLHGVYEGE